MSIYFIVSITTTANLQHAFGPERRRKNTSLKQYIALHVRHIVFHCQASGSFTIHKRSGKQYEYTFISTTDGSLETQKLMDNLHSNFSSRSNCECLSIYCRHSSWLQKLYWTYKVKNNIEEKITYDQIYLNSIDLSFHNDQCYHRTKLHKVS